MKLLDPAVHGLEAPKAASFASWSWCIPNECFMIFLQNVPNQNVNFRNSNQEVHFKSTQTRLRTAKHSQMHPPIIPDRSLMPSPVQIRILRISFSADLRSVSLYLSRSHLPARSQNLIFSKKNSRRSGVSNCQNLWTRLGTHLNLSLKAHSVVVLVYVCVYQTSDFSEAVFGLGHLIVKRLRCDNHFYNR